MLTLHAWMVHRPSDLQIRTDTGGGNKRKC